jgi:flavin-dependent dehydrogenase
MPSHGDVRDFDVVVIGAGPAGAAAAELGGVLGHSVALVEQDIWAWQAFPRRGAPRCSRGPQIGGTHARP